MAKQKKQSLLGKVRTRVAPSPTGEAHVGTAFQALLNWVYAKRYDGQFILRIEDTDQKRLDPEAEAKIYQALAWLEIEPDEGPQTGGPSAPYRQSERLDIYQQYAQQLVEQGDAYYCFCSQERLAQLRVKQRQAGRPPQYDGRCRQLSTEESRQKLAAGEKAVIRMKVPANEAIVVKDVLRGEVTFDSKTIDEQVLLKSDGFPTYHLAVVVDDHLMKITHLVRGEEWLPSSPKHILLYRYFDWQAPQLIHTPTLRNPDRSKLSKRKGNTALWWYREQGYLPQALLNFLALMVWKPHETQEIFSLQEMIAQFEWREMNITGPIFDLKKLKWMNGKYLRKLNSDEAFNKFTAWLTWVQEYTSNRDVKHQAEQLKQWQQQDTALFKQSFTLSRDRARVFIDFYQLMKFYFTDNLSYDAQELLQEQTARTMQQALTRVVKNLNQLTEYNAQVWEKTVRATADELDLPHKDLFMSMRTALTGEKYTPPLYDVMQVLGWEQSFKRLRQAADYLSSLPH